MLIYAYLNSFEDKAMQLHPEINTTITVFTRKSGHDNYHEHSAKFIRYHDMWTIEINEGYNNNRIINLEDTMNFGIEGDEWFVVHELHDD